MAKKKNGQHTIRSTKAECDFREQAVYKLILDGLTTNQICQYAADTWDVSQRQAERCDWAGDGGINRWLIGET